MWLLDPRARFESAPGLAFAYIGKFPEIELLYWVASVKMLRRRFSGGLSHEPIHRQQDKDPKTSFS